MKGAGESLRESSSLMKSLSGPKTHLKVGSWNVRTMFSIGKTAQVAREARRYDIGILGISECRWNGFGRLRTSDGDTIIYSGREEDDAHSSGVAILIRKEEAMSLESWTPVNDRIIKARFYSKYIKTTVIQVYAPTNEAPEDVKDAFYEQLQAVIEDTPTHDMLILQGDFNAKVGRPGTGEEGIVGKFGLHEDRTDNGDRLVSLCMTYNLSIVTTAFKHKEIHKHTWTSPNGNHHNQIDHIAVSRRFRSSVSDARSYRGADVGSDHHLIVADVKLKLSRTNGVKNKSKKYDTLKLKLPEIQKEFRLELQNRFACLQDMELDDVEAQWTAIKESYQKTAEKTLGYHQRKCKPWISEQSWRKVEERRKLKEKINTTKSERIKEQRRQEYRAADNETKKSLRRDKRTWANELSKEAETAANNGNLKGVYDATRTLSGEWKRTIDVVKDKNGKLLTNERDVQARWQEHFRDILNRPAPENPITDTDIQRAPPIDDIRTDYVQVVEIKEAIRHMKSRRSGGSDAITAELLKADLESTAKVMEQLLQQVWDEDRVPVEWRDGLIVKIPKRGDLSQCTNWRGITLMSVPAKILSRVLVKRISAGVDTILRDEQAGFRKGRGTNEHIHTLRNIIEQANEWNSNLYTCFIDYEKAFDCVHRESLWNILRSYGIPEKIITIITALYTDTKCAVLGREGPSEPFGVFSGVKQGCPLSGLLFIMVIDWVMTQTTKEARRGLQWTLQQQLEDLDYADDLVLFSNTHRQMQEKFNKLVDTGASLGLKVNTKKTKVMRMNNVNTAPITANNEVVEDVTSFTYLGSEITHTGGSGEDIKARLGKAQGAFYKLRKIWNDGQLSKRTKLRILRTNVLAVLFYGCETWRMTKTDEMKLNTFLHKCIRRILKIRWPMKVSNEDLLERTQMKPASQEVKRRRWKWIGHVLRMEPSRHPRIALTWRPQGKRKRGRPRETWRRTTEIERAQLHLASWDEARRAALDRGAWRSQISCPIFLNQERRK